MRKARRDQPVQVETYNTAARRTCAKKRAGLRVEENTHEPSTLEGNPVVREIFRRGTPKAVQEREGSRTGSYVYKIMHR